MGGFRTTSRRIGLAAGLLALGTACGGSAGTEDSEILAPFPELAGGIVFASSAIEGSRGYDLWWSPLPDFPTLDAQPVVRLTDAGGDQWQPSVSPGGNGLAFASSGDGIFLVTTTGRIRRISDTSGTDFRDSLPAVSWAGDRVAWVREDSSRPVGNSGFFETSIWVANADGTEARQLAPTPNTVQDSPKFEPRRGGARVAWTEFAADTVGPEGPLAYGVRVFDLATNTDTYVCRGDVIVENVQYRCFGQHLAWTVNDALVLPQSFLELYLSGQDPTASYFPLLESLNSQQAGAPVLQATQPGFFAPFPLSVSYQNLQRMIIDGLVTSVEGNVVTLAFFVAGVDGKNVWRLEQQGRRADYDPINTAGFLFSVATPQIVPPIQGP